MESYCECNLKLCFGCSECGCDHESEVVKDILEMSDAIERALELHKACGPVGEEYCDVCYTPTTFRIKPADYPCDTRRTLLGEKL